MKIIAALLAAGLLVAATAPDPTRIGVVDLDAVFGAIPQKAEVEKDLSLFVEEARKRVEALQADRAAKVQERSLLDSASTAHRELTRQILALESDIQFEQKSTARELEKRKNEHHENLLASTMRAVDEYASANGYDVILQREFARASTGKPWQSVLFATEAVDVTDEIVAGLKKE